MARDLRQRVLLITGASSGIGAATALEAARHGVRLALGARRVDKLDAVAARARALGAETLVAECDVDRDDHVDRFVKLTLERFGGVDLAFANAGYGLNATVADTTDAQLRAIFETNFFGTMRLLRAVLPIMRGAPLGAEPRALRGHVLICSSAASEVSIPWYGAYAATKAAQDAIAGSLRAELHHERIAVTSVHPIGTVTEFSQAVRAEPGRRVRTNTPERFLQTAEHVARCVVRAMRANHPPPEVWPSTPSRFTLALATAFPRATAWFLRRRFEHISLAAR